MSDDQTATTGRFALTLDARGYRSFRDPVSWSLRPLTVLYGRNQAGKSTLLRLLPALADSMFRSRPVLDLSSPAFASATFKELGWLGPNPTMSPELRMQAGEAWLVIQLTNDEGPLPNVVRVGQGTSPTLDVSYAGAATRTADRFEAAYAGEREGQPWQGRLRFESFLPDIAAPEWDGAVRRRFESLRVGIAPLERIQWLAGSRPPARAGAADAARRVRCCLPDGSDLADLLRSRADVWEAATEWLRRQEDLGESVHVAEDGTGALQMALRRSGGELLPLHLAGEGVRWLLPILLCACWAASGTPDAPTMLAIEEPEARLHPTLQIALLERLFALVARNIPCVIETHSVYVLRRIQLEVAKGRLGPEDVAIAWVERKDHAGALKPVCVQPDGTLQGWHPSTFEEEQRLSRDLFQARWARRMEP